MSEPIFDRDRLDADDANCRVHFLQVTADAADGAAGADAGKEIVDIAAGLPPDFGAGREVVGLGVVHVVVLIGVKRVGCLAGDPLGDLGGLCRITLHGSIVTAGSQQQSAARYEKSKDCALQHGAVLYRHDKYSRIQKTV